jgi:plastocyanin
MFQTPTPTRHQLMPLLPTALLVAALALSVLPAAAQEPRTMTVVLTEYKFTPDTITLTAGQPVQLNIQNQGKADHNLSSDDLPLMNINYARADNSTQDLSRYVSTNVLNADALSGHTSVVTFTPTTAGTFGFFSEDEESLGMVGKFVVVAPGGQAATAPPPTAATAPPASATVAKDGQSLAGQPAATQAMFTGVWGDRAAQQWAQEHNAALPH